MYTLAPELRALMTILRSTGPVISTRRSWMSSGMGATCRVAQLAQHTPLATLLTFHVARAPPKSAAWTLQLGQSFPAWMEDCSD